MEAKNEVITISVHVNAPVAKVWKLWNTPEDIKKWNNASPDWHTPNAEVDLRVGGKFSSRIEAKEGSFGFEFLGVYDVVTPEKYLEYTLGDNRKVKINFTDNGNETFVEESFVAETQNPIEMQRAGWQAILDNFKKYADEK